MHFVCTENQSIPSSTHSSKAEISNICKCDLQSNVQASFEQLTEVFSAIDIGVGSSIALAKPILGAKLTVPFRNQSMEWIPDHKHNRIEERPSLYAQK